MNNEYYYGTGRRKTSIARVRLYPGEGEIIVNGKNVREYFGGREAHQITVLEPLRITNSTQRFNVLVKVIGGGISGQAGAIRHGIARALLGVDETFRGALRKQGLLTRDPRVKERKKPGLVRARRAKQYTKR